MEDRRSFIKKSSIAMGGLSLGLGPTILKSGSKNEILNIGVIGTGDRGGRFNTDHKKYAQPPCDWML